MKQQSNHRRHQSISDGLDIMSPPGLSIDDDDDMIDHHHHHHRPYGQHQRHETVSNVPLIHNHNQHHVQHHQPKTMHVSTASTNNNNTNNNMNRRPQRSLFGNYVAKRQHDMIELENATLEFLVSMETNSTFFTQNPPQPIPSFERSEIHVDGVLGMGEFGVVSKVSAICPNPTSSSSSSPLSSLMRKNITANGGGGGGDDSSNPPPLMDDNPSTSSSSPTTKTKRKPTRSSTMTTTTLVKTYQSCNDLDWLKESSRSVNSRQLLTGDGTNDDDYDDDNTAYDDDEDDSFEIQQELQRQALIEKMTVNNSNNQKKNDNGNNGQLTMNTCADPSNTTTTTTTKNSTNHRYYLAMKQLRKDLYPKKKIQASQDLAREAKLLTSLNHHPNIVSLSGIVSQPGRIDFGILMDYLPITLDEQKTKWKEQCLYSSQYIFPWQSQQRILAFRKIFTERVIALRDIARAMSHLHKKMILFRDLKAENCARANDGVTKLFDFGLAKELKAMDCINRIGNKNSNNIINNNQNYHDLLYKATGLTGTLRIMAPEVIQCHPYNFSADVYSFGILIYEIFQGERCQLLAAEVCKGQRPSIPPHMSRPFSDLLKACWSEQLSDRPTMQTICKQLELECDQSLSLLLESSAPSRSTSASSTASTFTFTSTSSISISSGSSGTSNPVQQ